MKKKAGKIKTFFIDIFFGGREYKTTAAAERTPLPVKTVVCFAAATILLLTMIFSFIKISELSGDIVTARRRIANLEEEEEKLRSELEHKYSFAEIVELAESMGYVENGGQIVYIEIDSDEENKEKNDEKEIAEEE